jgi:chemotaxis response regulator CheB
VLIVDDVPDMRSVLRLVFDLDARYEVVGEAADGQEAITAAELLQPDVIILDWEMPGLNGFEALPAIKQNARSALVVVVYSAHHREDRGPADSRRDGIGAVGPVCLARCIRRRTARLTAYSSA